MIERLRNAFKSRKASDLKKISNAAIEQAAMSEDRDMVSIPLISYCLYKLLSKEHMEKQESWNRFLENVDKDLDEAVEIAKRGEPLVGILEKEIIHDIAQIDDSYGNYAKDIVYKARIKQASRIYAMGISLSTAIALTGADKMESYGYVGTTKIHDRPFTSNKTVVDRLKHVRTVFGEDER